MKPKKKLSLHSRKHMLLRGGVNTTFLSLLHFVFVLLFLTSQHGKGLVTLNGLKVNNKVTFSINSEGIFGFLYISSWPDYSRQCQFPILLGCSMQTRGTREGGRESHPLHLSTFKNYFIFQNFFCVTRACISCIRIK